MNTVDTIAAISTGTGGAISIIRISGGKALELLNSVWKGRETHGKHNSRKMILGKMISGGEPVLAVYMPGPNSYTGDDIAEIHCHGGSLSAKNALEKVLSAGARSAEPGEFTYRAFINGKMDLTQAEAVADIISAHSEMALRLAEKQISGLLKNSVDEIRNGLVNILAECESRMDFPEENLDWTDKNTLSEMIRDSRGKTEKLLLSRKEGIVLREGIRVVIAGKPNVGKSSLMNLLLGFDRAIVTKIPGTTRDTLEEFANIRNIPVRLIDTAGIREAGDIIENMGINRSRAVIREAQIVVWMLDASSENPEDESADMTKHIGNEKNIIALWNKIDMMKNSSLPDTGFTSASISIKNNSGMDSFLDIFEKTVWGYPHAQGPEVAVSSRHASLLDEVLKELPEAAEKVLSEDWELAASNLRSAVNALGKITGQTADPDILENIFSRFCIGK
ncbi:MAG: tRNA uridine-5-carboxymethylaminomethyl(34) synthesis GTPase MnmE [Lentisphaerae bacterium GWF2_44_16]|nr:MAG: tRNA uridine-5-carboxymethylaminomethyl(34) synthesis GTPase MnmE [Lentisphaerae bacterium GWF2_44_16]